MKLPYVDEITYATGKVDRIESDTLIEHVNKIELHLRDLLLDMGLRTVPFAVVAGVCTAFFWHIAGWAWALVALLVCLMVAEELFNVGLSIMEFSHERRNPWIQIYHERLRQLSSKQGLRVT